MQSGDREFYPIARHGPLSTFVLAITFGLIGLAHAGCSTVRDFDPQVDPDSLDATTFLHYLGTVPTVSVAEGCRAMLIAADGQDKHDTFEERYAELLERDAVRQAWHLQADHVLDKSTAAFMAFRVCRLPGGVNTLLIGSWGLSDRRYALREVVHAGLMPYATPAEAMRGGELLALLAKMDEYMAEHKAYDWEAAEVDSPEDVHQQPPGQGAAISGSATKPATGP